MTGLANLRDGIKTVLESEVTNLTVYPRFEGQIAIAPGGGAVVVQVADINYDVSFQRSTMHWNFDLYVMTSAAVNSLGQYDIDELIDITGSRSIVASLYTENLGFTDTFAHVTGMREYGAQFSEAQDIPHIGAILSLEVITKGA